MSVRQSQMISWTIRPYQAINEINMSEGEHSSKHPTRTSSFPPRILYRFCFLMAQITSRKKPSPLSPRSCQSDRPQRLESLTCCLLRASTIRPCPWLSMSIAVSSTSLSYLCSQHLHLQVCLFGGDESDVISTVSEQQLLKANHGQPWGPL